MCVIYLWSVYRFGSPGTLWSSMCVIYLWSVYRFGSPGTLWSSMCVIYLWSVYRFGYLVPYGLPCVSYIYGLSTGSGPLVPYGLPCVRELFCFLMSLTNPLDRQNTDVMVHMGLSLLTVALEAGADHISSSNLFVQHVGVCGVGARIFLFNMSVFVG